MKYSYEDEAKMIFLMDDMKKHYPNFKKEDYEGWSVEQVMGVYNPEVASSAIESFTVNNIDMNRAFNVVDANGVVKEIKIGSTKITVSTEDGKYSASFPAIPFNCVLSAYSLRTAFTKSVGR